MIELQKALEFCRSFAPLATEQDLVLAGMVALILPLALYSWAKALGAAPRGRKRGLAARRGAAVAGLMPDHAAPVEIA